MLYEKGAQFDGNRYTDLFRHLIFYFIEMSGRLFSGALPVKPKQNPANSGKVLYVTRDWGAETMLSREITRSLREYCGSQHVEALVVRRYDDIVSAIASAIDGGGISHVLLDTRVTITGKGFSAVTRALYSAWGIARLLKSQQVVCLCGTLDWIRPGNRLLAELVTSLGGIAISWGSVGFHEAPSFRHHRKIGPVMPPTSLATLSELSQKSKSAAESFDIAIMGANYEPRKSLIESVLRQLQKEQIKIYVNTSKDLCYVDYLSVYTRSRIGLNTNWVAGQPNKYHLVARNFEIMLAGSLLLTQKCYGLDLYVQDGRDYVSYHSESDLIEKIYYYLSNEDKRAQIASSGNKQTLQLINSQFWWTEVDKALYTFHLPKLCRESTITRVSV